MAISRVMHELMTLEALVKEVHWNSQGAGFISVHRYLDEVYETCEEYIDEIAEHLVAYEGKKPQWHSMRYHFYGETWQSGVEQILQRIVRIIHIIGDIEDVHRDAEDILVRLSQALHKHGWFLDAEVS